MASRRMNVLVYSGAIFQRHVTSKECSNTTQALAAPLNQFGTASTHYANYWVPTMLSFQCLVIRSSTSLGSPAVLQWCFLVEQIKVIVARSMEREITEFVVL